MLEYQKSLPAQSILTQLRTAVMCSGVSAYQKLSSQAEGGLRFLVLQHEEAAFSLTAQRSSYQKIFGTQQDETP